MPKEEVLSILDDLKKKKDIIDAVKQADLAAKMSNRDTEGYLAITAGLFSQEKIEQALEIARNAIPTLRSALLKLSPQEAKEVMQIALADEDYENMIARVLIDKNTLMSEKIILGKLIFPDEADQAVSKLLQKWIDAADAPEKQLKGRISHSELESEDFKKFRAELDKTLLFYIPLKSLHEEKVVSDEVVGLALDAYHFKKAEDMEKLSEALANIISQVDNLDILEKVARIWGEVLPDSLDTKLKKMYLGTSNPKVRENIKNMIILQGKNPLQLIQGDQVMGDQIKLEGRFSGIVNIKAALWESPWVLAVSYYI